LRILEVCLITKYCWQAFSIEVRKFTGVGRYILACCAEGTMFSKDDTNPNPDPNRPSRRKILP